MEELANGKVAASEQVVSVPPAEAGEVSLNNHSNGTMADSKAGSEVLQRRGSSSDSNAETSTKKPKRFVISNLKPADDPATSPTASSNADAPVRESNAQAAPPEPQGKDGEAKEESASAAPVRIPKPKSNGTKAIQPLSTSRIPRVIPKTMDDPAALLGAALRIKRALEKQQSEIKSILLGEQRQRIQTVEGILPDRMTRMMRVIDRKVQEAVKKKAAEGKLSFELPEEYVPDALEVWAFCHSHEKSLRIKIGTFRDFERALLEKEPNATFDAVAVGLLNAINAKLLGKVTKFLVNELTWPEVARRTLVFIGQAQEQQLALEASKAMMMTGEEVEGDVADEIQSRSMTENGGPGTTMDVISNEAQSQNGIVTEDDSEETPPTWRTLEKDPLSLFVHPEDNDKPTRRGSMSQEQWTALCKKEKDDLAAVWTKLCSEDVAYQLDMFERVRGVLNRTKAEPTGKQVWSVDYRDCLKSAQEIPLLADLATVEELLRAKYYTTLEAFSRDLEECYGNMERLLEHKTPKELKRDLLDALAHTREEIQEYIHRWVLLPAPFTRGPWTIWARTDPQETTACRVCRGQRRFPKKTIPPLTLHCRTCKIPFHQDCYESFTTGQPLKPLLLKTQANLAAVAAQRKRAGIGAGSPRASSKNQEFEDNPFQCSFCSGMEMAATNVPAASEGSCLALSQDDFRQRVWRAGETLPSSGISVELVDRLAEQPSHTFWGGLRSGKETPTSLMRLATKLGRCEPADLDLRERLRLLLFLSREASNTEACREEADAALAQVRDLQIDFNKCRKSWLDDCTRSLELGFSRFGHVMRRELKKKMPVFPTVLEVCREEFSNEESAIEREGVKEYLERVKRFMERGGLDKEAECRLFDEAGKELEDDTTDLGFTLDSEDESVIEPNDDGENGDETESEYDSDDSLVPPPTALQAKLINTTGFEAAIAGVNMKRFEAFARTLDPETIPEFTPLELALAQSVNLGPSIEDMTLHESARLLPAHVSEYTHPACFGFDLIVMRDMPQLKSFDVSRTSPVFLGVLHTQKPKQTVNAAEFGRSLTTEDAAEAGGEQPSKKRAKKAEGPEAPVSGKGEESGGGDPAAATAPVAEVKRRRRRTRREMELAAATAGLGGAGGDGDESSVLNPKLAACPLCAIPFDLIERVLHKDCQAVLDRINELLVVSSEDRRLINALANAFFQAEMESFTALMRCEPLGADSSHRYWRFRGDLDVMYAEELTSGRMRIVNSAGGLPLKLKWFFSGAGLKSPAVAKAKVITAQFLSTPTELPLVLDPPRLRAQSLFMNILGSSRYSLDAGPLHCSFCMDALQPDDWHCLVCHQTFLGTAVDEERILAHVKTCCGTVHPAMARMESIETCLRGPRGISSNAWTKFARLKQLIIDLEAGLPANAMRYKIDNLTGEITSEQRTKVRILVGGWESDRRAMWINRVRRCVTPVQLYRLLRMLEGAIDPRWTAAQSCLPALVRPGSAAVVAPSTAVPLETPIAEGEAPAQQASQAATAVSVPIAPPPLQDDVLSDVVVARVALKLFTLDQDIRFEAVS